MKLAWSALARHDRQAILDYIGRENPAAAIALDRLVAHRAGQLKDNPHLGRTGRVAGTRELIVHPNYLILYDVTADTVRILRILHAAMRWPAP